MATPYQKALLDGTATDIPEVSSKIVRVFISSTFSDMIWERNALMEKVYPRLKEYCRDHYGLEFQAVDMRWGVHAEAQNDHQASSLCLQEIKNCQQLSVGPNFVILMGQKYGSRPFPTYIIQEEFELLLSVIGQDDPDLELLKTWFKLDENSIPSKYILQPISSILTHYNDQDNALRTKDEKMWGEVYTRLMTLLRKSAALCHEQGKMDDRTRDSYFMSVTENEILHGVLQYKGDISKKCLCFVRNIENLSDNLQHIKAVKFIDLKATSLAEVDEEAADLLRRLKDEKIPAVVPEGNICKYSVTWDDQSGINPDTHSEYLNQLCDDFFSKMTQLIDDSLTNVSGLQQDQLFTEVVQHIKMEKAWTSVFHGRQEVLVAVEKYIRGPSRQPLIVHGPSGSGKTAVMAKCASLTHTWLGKESPVVILRFLGITPKSSGIRPVLESVCRQLCTLYNKDPTTVPLEFSQLAPFFRELLQVATVRRPIVIYLDSVDQLSPANFAFKLTWLPKVLPPHVKLVLSTLPDMYGILANLETFLKEEENFIHLEPLGDVVSQETLFDRLDLVHRTLNQEQQDVVLGLFKQCSLPLFTKVMFEEICAWKSYTHVTADNLSSSIEGAIEKMLERLEGEHGQVLVSHALAYLTASKNGLTMVELEDLLSLDDEVLNSVFTFWLPPIRRIPPAILTRLRLQLQGYVVDREADGVAVIYWYHRKFIEVARTRYLSSKELAVKIHSTLADYFSGVWGGGKQKPFSYTEFLAARLSLKEKGGKADRKVPIQPLQFHHGEGEEVAFNMRKLRELPQQLVESGRLQDLITSVVFSYEWYIAKIKAFSLQDLLADLLLAQRVVPEEKPIKHVIDVLRLGASALNTNPDCLSLELTGRLIQFYDTDKNIRNLIDGCDQSRDCMLTVPFQCFDGPTESLLFSLEGHNKSIIDAVFIGERELASFGWDGMICYWDLTSGELLKQVDASFIEPNLRAFLLLSRDGKYLVALNKVSAKYLGIYLAETGDLLHKYEHSHSQHLHKLLIGKKYLCVDFAIVELETGKVLHRLNKYNVSISRYVFIDFSMGEQYMMIGGDTETTMYEIVTCKKVFSIPGEDIASHIKMTEDGKFALIGYVVSCLVKIVDVDAKSSSYGKVLRTIDLPHLFPDVGIASDQKDFFVQEVSDFNISVDGSQALVLLKRFYIAVWDLHHPELSPALMQSPELPDDAGRYHRYHFMPTFTPDGKHIVCYKLDGFLNLWRVEDGTYLKEITAHNTEIMHLHMNVTSKLMATVAKDELTVKIWNVDQLVATPKREDNNIKGSYVRYLLIPPDYDNAISLRTVTRYSRKAYHMIDYFGLDLWDIQNSTKKSILPFGQFGQVLHMDCSDDGTVMLLLMGNLTQRRIRLIDLEQSRLIFSGTQPYCVRARLSKNGKYIASVTNDEETYVTTVRTSEAGSVIGLYENCHDAVFLSDSSMAVVLSTGGELQTHDLQNSSRSSLSTGYQHGHLIPLGGELSGKVLVLSRPNKKNRRNGMIVNTQPVEKLGMINSIAEHGIEALSADGKTVIDSDLQVFDLVTCKMIRQLQSGVRATAGLVKLLGKGNLAVFVDAKITDLLKVCRISDNKVVASCNLHSTPVCLEVSPHSNRIVISTNQGQVLVLILKQFDWSNDVQNTEDMRQQRNVIKCTKKSSLNGILSEFTPTFQTLLHDLAKQARVFSFNVTTLEPKKSDLQSQNSSTCSLV